jgi:phosphoribosyl-ATP pyrophosphohydrolase/phosphoribosyl-AMP cyclohydrolase/histidinol dehydrogenase
MDTTLPLPFLPTVDLGKGPVESTEGLTRKQLSYLGCVHFVASSANVDTLLQFLQGHSGIETYVDVTAIDSTDDVISILDAGARKVFVAVGQQLDSLKAYPDRVVPVFSTQDHPASGDIYSNGVLFNAGDDKSPSEQVLQQLKARKVSPIFLVAPKIDFESAIKVATEYSAIPIIPATRLTIDKADKERISVPAAIGGSWSSDRPDKLIPTVVTDERGIALGLVYSSEESLAESLKTGTGVYQSRKRGLWYKGATSGDTQELVRVALDCDQDCLKFVVRQKGRGMCIRFRIVIFL